MYNNQHVNSTTTRKMQHVNSTTTRKMQHVNSATTRKMQHSSKQMPLIKPEVTCMYYH